MRGLARSGCTLMSSSVGGLILTPSLFAPAQSELARADNCWRSCRECPGDQARGRSGPMQLSTKGQGVSPQYGQHLMVGAQADRHGGEEGSVREGEGRARALLRFWCAPRPLCVHARRRVWEASSLRTSSSPLRSRQNWRTSSSRLSSISSALECGLDADGSETTR